MDLPPLIRFGTSTWTYEGWQGQIYKREYKKTLFARECLGEYCQYLYNGEPLFRTVGNDSTFYRPPTANQLQQTDGIIPQSLPNCPPARAIAAYETGDRDWETLNHAKYSNTEAILAPPVVSAAWTTTQAMGKLPSQVGGISTGGTEFGSA
jgi:hypothetical protein